MHTTFWKYLKPNDQRKLNESKRKNIQGPLQKVSGHSFLNQSFYQLKCCRAALLRASERDE